MTLTQGHGCDIDKQKFACLQDKVRTTQPITTKLGNYIPLNMFITWLEFGGILLETLFISIKYKFSLTWNDNSVISVDSIISYCSISPPWHPFY